MNLNPKKKELHLIIKKVEKIIEPAAKLLNDFMAVPQGKIPTAECRKALDKLETLNKDMFEAGIDLQKKMKHFHEESKKHPKSNMHMICQGLEKLAHANVCMGKAISKTIQLATIELNPRSPNKTQVASLKSEIKVHIKEAQKSFKEGCKLIIDGIKLVATQALDVAQKLPSKASMLFNGLKRHMSAHTVHEHHNHHQHKKPKHHN